MQCPRATRSIVSSARLPRRWRAMPSVAASSAPRSSPRQPCAQTAREGQRDNERARLVQQRAAAVATAAAQGAIWRDLLGALGELLLVEDPATAAGAALAADRQSIARARLEAARTTRSQTEAATKAAQDAQAEAELGRVALDQLVDRRRELERRSAELDAAI